MSRAAPRFPAFMLAAVATAVLASVLQTQLNLAAITALGAEVSGALRAWTTLEDLARFGPVMVGIAAGALLPAFVIAHRVVGVASRRSAVVFAVLAFAALWSVFGLMRSVIPMPAIPGTRDPWHHLFMALTGVAGGLTYVAAMRSMARREAGGRRLGWRAHALGLLLVLAPVVSFVVAAPRVAEPVVDVDPRTYDVDVIAEGLDRPWSLAPLPDGRLLVTEMRGRLLAIARDGGRAVIATDALPPIHHQGRTTGLMDVVIDPAFADNGRLYLSMAYGERGAIGTRLVRATLRDDRLDDVQVLFETPPRPSAGNSGGRIAWLGDGSLVLTLGDGSARREEALNLANPLGTLVRLDRDGRVPADNPFVGVPNARPEILSLGHRNVQGIAADPSTGDLFVSEHGPRGGDEINRIVAGGNYGWPVVTDGIDYPFARVSPFRSLEGYRDPELAWVPSIAPAGLAIHRGGHFRAWNGDLLVPALKERALRRVVRRDGVVVRQERLLQERGERLRDVRVDADGAILVLTEGEAGTLLRVTPRMSEG
ncbi:PQQ-dependent sugar dehydrogenase [Dokdonella sp. MW10]|uniref:PQQ-dependent sugar dehydrogenase n=1 Tax=Dokdonella sp. MW10 TaxID=2992926 RepID=UPI003F7F4723